MDNHQNSLGEILLRPFSRVAIINLPRRSDRRCEMERELDRIGLKFNCSKLSFFSAIEPTETHGFDTVGILGCFLSHLSLLRQARKDRVESILILEDDADFDLPPKDELEKILEPLSADSWDVIYLGYHYPKRFLEEHQRGVHDFGKTYNIGGSHAIAFSRRVIPHLIEYLEKILEDVKQGHPRPMHIDGAYTEFRRNHLPLVTYVAVPALSFQRRSASDIQNLNFYDRIGPLRTITSKLRRWMPRRES
jgi:GR25 family glycosyltransferase involved in LPS biosynthesis